MSGHRAPPCICLTVIDPAQHDVLNEDHRVRDAAPREQLRQARQQSGEVVPLVDRDEPVTDLIYEGRGVGYRGVEKALGAERGYKSEAGRAVYGGRACHGTEGGTQSMNGEGGEGHGAEDPGPDRPRLSWPAIRQPAGPCHATWKP